MILDTLAIVHKAAEHVTTWPDVAMAVGPFFGIGLMFWLVNGTPLILIKKDKQS